MYLNKSNTVVIKIGSSIIIDENKKIKSDFLKKHKVNLITLSTFDKKSISKIKSKLIKYVS